MRWEGERESSNVEDRRSRPGYRGGGLPIGGRGIGVGTIVIALVAGWLLGVNPLTLLGLLGEGELAVPTESSPAPEGTGPAPHDAGARFVSVVLASTEDVWSREFAQRGARYEPPVLVLFRGTTPTACGYGDAAAGPFYCPADRRVYIDLDFFQVLQQRLGAAGDFAQAYVVAHEVGHHVQNLAGLTDRMASARTRLSERDYNSLSVMLELQADCYAGVWVRRSEQARGWLEHGDIEEAIGAAARSATTGCSGRRAAWSSPTRSPTAVRRSGCSGSGPGWRAVGSRPATPSPKRGADPTTRARRLAAAAARVEPHVPAQPFALAQRSVPGRDLLLRVPDVPVAGHDCSDVATAVGGQADRDERERPTENTPARRGPPRSRCSIAEAGAPTGAADARRRPPVTDTTGSNPGGNVDLDEVARLVEQLERDLALAREGSRDIDTLRDEVERLRGALAARPAAQAEVSEGLYGLKERLHAVGDELFDDAVTASRYAAWLGRLLGM